MINRNRFLNIQQFVIDPDREYAKLCDKLGGAIIKFGAKQIINIFDIRETVLEPGESFLRNKVSKLNIFFSLIFENLTEEEKSLIEEIIIKCYEEKGITEDNETLYEIDANSKILNKKIFLSQNKMPILSDFYNLLKKDKKLKRFVTILKPYMKYLNNYTNVDDKNKLIVVDIHEVSEEEMPIVMFIITDFFWDIIKKDI